MTIKAKIYDSVKSKAWINLLDVSSYSLLNVNSVSRFILRKIQFIVDEVHESETRGRVWDDWD